MSVTNTIMLAGYCGNEPSLLLTENKRHKAILILYSHDYVPDLKKYIKQRHDCVLFGNVAKNFVKAVEQGRYIIVKGMLYNMKNNQSDTLSIIPTPVIHEFQVAPRQSLAALRELTEEILKTERITSIDELAIFNKK